jgi:hypothetical protein
VEGSPYGGTRNFWIMTTVAVRAGGAEFGGQADEKGASALYPAVDDIVP